MRRRTLAGLGGLTLAVALIALALLVGGAAGGHGKGKGHSNSNGSNTHGRIGFHWQRKRVNRWLRRRGEPFLWASTRTALADVVRPWRVIRFGPAPDLLEEILYLTRAMRHVHFRLQIRAPRFDTHRSADQPPGTIGLLIKS